MKEHSPSLAPIALFAYRRPEHTRRAIEALLANPEADESRWYVYCDGARSDRDRARVEETRSVVREFDLTSLRMVERDLHLGLAKSVTMGVTEVCESHGRVVVVEDDLDVAPTFLRFMNQALNRYENDERVFSISGYMFPVEPPPAVDAVFLPFYTSWGWATWERAWRRLVLIEEARDRILRNPATKRRFDLARSYPYSKLLKAQLAGKIDSWAIRWYATIFLSGGVSLFPARSLVTNAGLDGTGTHAESWKPKMYSAVAAPLHVERFPDAVEIEEAVFARVKRLLRSEAYYSRRLPRELLQFARRLLDRLRTRR